MEFQFVDNNATNESRSRKTIRSHVMKGKNRGKSIQRGRKNVRPNLVNDVPHQKLAEAAIKAQASIFPEIAASNSSAFSNPFNGHEFEYFAFPIQFTPTMRNLVYQC